MNCEAPASTPRKKRALVSNLRPQVPLHCQNCLPCPPTQNTTNERCSVAQRQRRPTIEAAAPPRMESARFSPPKNKRRICNPNTTARRLPLHIHVISAERTTLQHLCLNNNILTHSTLKHRFSPLINERAHPTRTAPHYAGDSSHLCHRSSSCGGVWVAYPPFGFWRRETCAFNARRRGSFNCRPALTL